MIFERKISFLLNNKQTMDTTEPSQEHVAGDSTIPCEICNENVPFDQYLRHCMESHFVPFPPPPSSIPPIVANAATPSISDWQEDEDIHPAAWHTGILMHRVAYSDALSFTQISQSSQSSQSRGGREGGIVYPMEVVQGALERPNHVAATFTKDDVCPICLASFQTEDETVTTAQMDRISEIRTCKHLFCTPCISRWLSTHNSCPMCKQEVYPEINVLSRRSRHAVFRQRVSDRDILLVASSLARTRIDQGSTIIVHRLSDREDEQQEDNEEDEEEDDEEDEEDEEEDEDDEDED